VIARGDRVIQLILQIAEDHHETGGGLDSARYLSNGGGSDKRRDGEDT
jgi:hypothetical protein